MGTQSREVHRPPYFPDLATSIVPLNDGSTIGEPGMRRLSVVGLVARPQLCGPLRLTLAYRVTEVTIDGLERVIGAKRFAVCIAQRILDHVIRYLIDERQIMVGVVIA